MTPTKDYPELDAIFLQLDMKVDEIFKKYHQTTSNESLRNDFLTYICIAIQKKINPNDKTWDEKIKMLKGKIFYELSQPKQEPQKGDIR